MIYWPPAQSVDWLTEKYVHARLKKLHFYLRRPGFQQSGIFSLFTEKFRDSSWNILLQELKIRKMVRYRNFGEKVNGYSIPVLNNKEIRAAAGMMFLAAFISLVLILSQGDFCAG